MVGSASALCGGASRSFCASLVAPSPGIFRKGGQDDAAHDVCERGAFGE